MRLLHFDLADFHKVAAQFTAAVSEMMVRTPITGVGGVEG